MRDPRAPGWACPVCGYRGAFRTVTTPYGARPYADCPRCGAGERDRLQRLVLAERIAPAVELDRMRVLHVAPERFVTEFLRPRVAAYETADISAENVDHEVDLRDLPFADGSYDLVYASHVLEHIDDDRRALSEVRRVLSGDGLAILPVPIVQQATVEYGEPLEAEHVRAPGRDYFDRYREQFARVDVFSSEDFPAEHQLYVYEDRTRYPSDDCPRRTPTPGERHLDFVPLCWRSADTRGGLGDGRQHADPA